MSSMSRMGALSLIASGIASGTQSIADVAGASWDELIPDSVLNRIRKEAGDGATKAVAPVARAEAAKGAREAVTPMIMGVGALAGISILFSIIALRK